MGPQMLGSSMLVIEPELQHCASWGGGGAEQMAFLVISLTIP